MMNSWGMTKQDRGKDKTGRGEMYFRLGSFPMLESKDDSLADDLLDGNRKPDYYEVLEQNWREMKMIYGVQNEDKILKEVK